MSRTTTKPTNKATTSRTDIPVIVAPSASTGSNDIGREISSGQYKNKHTQTRTLLDLLSTVDTKYKEHKSSNAQ